MRGDIGIKMGESRIRKAHHASIVIDDTYRSISCVDAKNHYRKTSECLSTASCPEIRPSASFFLKESRKTAGFSGTRRPSAGRTRNTIGRNLNKNANTIHENRCQ